MKPALPFTAASRIALGLLLSFAASAVAAEDMRASAEITGCKDPKIHGTATLEEVSSDEGIREVRVHMKLTGLTNGKHAVHIHEKGACEPCDAAGGHHDPGPFGHTAPDTTSEQAPANDVNHPFHMGDLVNIEIQDGEGEMEHVTSRITLSPGRLSILDEDGSAFIVHTAADAYCDQETELKKGCAGGARDACGVIRAEQ